MCASLLVPFGSTNAFASDAPVTSANGGVKTSLHSPGKIDTQSKISSRLKEQFANDKYVTFLVKLKDQADTKKAASVAASLSKKQHLTAAKAKYAKRSAVVNALRATANETQAALVKYLDGEKKAGTVKNYESFYIVNGMGVTATKEVMDKLASFPEVEKLLPNETRQLNPVATDVKANPKAKTETTTGNVEWNIDRVGAPAVWNMGIDGTGVVVASIDTGVQWDHPALKEKYRGYNPANPNQPNNELNWFDAVSGQSSPYDDIGHGSHTMGTIVGSTSDRNIGIAPGAKWISVKAFSANGGTDIDLLEAGEWIIAPKDANNNPHPEMAPDVVNNSWGGGPGLDEWYRPMVQNWRAAGIFPEFSAGNTDIFNPGGPGSVAAPANYPESFATGATDINDHLASFSLQGPSPYGEIKPEVSAPGVNICSSVPGSQYDCTYSGTSMAGPHVTGAVALMLSADSSLTVDEIEQILMNTATPKTDSQFPESPNNGYGHGLLNAFNAVSSVTSGLGTIEGQVTKEGEDNEAPTYQHEAPSETFVGLNLPLQIAVQDNISITNVELQYKGANDSDWQTVQAERVDGNYKNAVYQVTIPGNVIAEPSLQYKWHISDYGQNDVTTDVYNVPVHPAITVGYTQDFESTPAGWQSFGDKNPWEWGVPTSGPGSAYSGQKVYATNLDGPYENYTNATLMMPPVQLPDGPSSLQFKHWYNLENNYDYGQVVISTDQQNWTTLTSFTNTSSGWQSAAVDLSAYAGQRVFLGFRLSTDVSVTRDGWYLDDVALVGSGTGSIKADLGVEKGKHTKAAADTNEKDAKKADKKPVDPSTIKPSQRENVKLPDSLSVKPDAAVQSLPLSATVSVLETGRFVNTNPADGSYSLLHAAGTYTLKAETYGYQSAEQTVDVTRDGTATANFTLNPIPQGTITGTITNKATGEPVANATVMLMEDANIQPVHTDETGAFSITAYEGTYTMHVSAPNFYTSDVEVTVTGNGSTTKDVELRPFIGYPGELVYDDGTAENAHAFYDAQNAWGVKMSLPEGHDSAMVTAGKFLFWTQDWPVPGGTQFQVEVYDATGPDGAPGNKLAGPIDATAKRDGSWTTVDLSNEGIVVNGDFYIVYVQTQPNPYAPGLATDEDGTNYGRSWQRVSGAWSPSPEDEGNYMIRADVSYEVVPPVITSPKDGTFTNQDTVTVTGKAAPTTTVTLYNNGEEAGTVSVGDDGTFTKDVTLSDGENVLTAKASTDNGSTDPSQPVKVVLDKAAPELTITSPTDGSKTNHETITVEGAVSDANLDTVTVNGQTAAINDDGTYSKRIMLDEGDNAIHVVARDKAGNEKNQEITVKAKFTAPVIENLKPTEDKYLDSGQTVTIEFDSEPGLHSSFVLQMPLTNPSNVSGANELPMTETSPGHYVGYYTATSNVKADGALIEVRARDDFGNETRKVADGKLFLNIPNEKPVPLFDAPAKPKKNQNVTFDGNASYDPDGQIVKYEWNFGDGSGAQGVVVTHKFNKGNFNVTLTVTDNRGAKASVTRKIQVK
ncbi:MAG: S8 family serine peptidase [Tuberibacillus sp.]